MRMASLKDYKQKSSRIWFWKCCSGSSVENHLEEDKRRGKTDTNMRGVCVCVCVCVCVSVSVSRVWLFASPWTVAHQAPLSMGFSRQEYLRGLSSPSPGDLPKPGIEPRSPALQADSLPPELPAERQWCDDNWIIHTSTNCSGESTLRIPNVTQWLEKDRVVGKSDKISAFHSGLGSQEQRKT